MCIYIYISMYIYVYICVYTHVCIYVYVHVHVFNNTGSGRGGTTGTKRVCKCATKCAYPTQT